MLSCGVCADEFDVLMDHFQCAADEAHIQCIACFGDFVRHCCANYATTTKVPLKCFLTDCATPMTEKHIEQLLHSQWLQDSGLGELYSKTLLKVGLDSHKEEIPITCQFCGLYSEFYVPATPEMIEWIRNNQRRYMIEIDVEVYEQKKQAENTYRERLLEIGQQLPRLVSEMLLKESKESDEKDIDTTSQRNFRLTVLSERLVTVMMDLEMNVEELDAILEDIKEDELAALLHEVSETSEVSNEQKERLRFFWNRLTPLLFYVYDHASSLTSKIRTEMEAEAKSWFNERHLELKSLASSKLRGDFIAQLVESLHDDVKQDVTLEYSTQFFLCKNDACTGAFCLSCERFIEKKECSEHQCKTNEVFFLYNEVINTLATSSTRSCPSCGYSGMKDFACTHITCNKCSAQWCYVCGRSSQDVGGFSTHNEWYLDTPEDVDRCPTYLQYKYGSQNNGNRMDGDSRLALHRFHFDLQMQAINQLEASSEPEVWAKMLEVYFADGEIVPRPE